MDILINKRFKMLNREAGLVSELISSGLENLRKVDRNPSFYYQSFYSLSIGIERLLKLLTYLDNPKSNLKNFGHEINSLMDNIGLSFPFGSIENKILLFLDDFNTGKRYCIIDFLLNEKENYLSDEPIVKFYNDILVEVLSIHPPRKIWSIPSLDGYARVNQISEDLSEINSFDDLIFHRQIINHASKYCAMYIGRILQPILEKLIKYDGPPKNPYFNEYFTFLIQPDSYFLKRKTFKS